MESPADSEPASPPENPPPNAKPSVATPRRTSTLWFVVGAVVVALVVVVAVFATGVIHLGGSGSSANSAKVDLTSATLSFPSNNPCVPAQFTTSGQANVSAGSTQTYNVPLTNQANGLVRACTVTAVRAITAGFNVTSANVPLPVNLTGRTILTISVSVPTTDFKGALQLNATVSYASPDVKVTGQNGTFSPASNPCGVHSSGITGSGFSGFAGAEYNDSLGFFVISPTQYCNLTAVTSDTPGFTVVSADTPVDLPIDSFSGVTFLLRLPSAPFSGNVTLTLTLSW